MSDERSSAIIGGEPGEAKYEIPATTSPIFDWRLYLPTNLSGSAVPLITPSQLEPFSTPPLPPLSAPVMSSFTPNWPITPHDIGKLLCPKLEIDAIRKRHAVKGEEEIKKILHNQYWDRCKSNALQIIIKKANPNLDPSGKKNLDFVKMGISKFEECLSHVNLETMRGCKPSQTDNRVWQHWVGRIDRAKTEEDFREIYAQIEADYPAPRSPNRERLVIWWSIRQFQLSKQLGDGLSFDRPDEKDGSSVAVSSSFSSALTPIASPSNLSLPTAQDKPDITLDPRIYLLFTHTEIDILREHWSRNRHNSFAGYLSGMLKSRFKLLEPVIQAAWTRDKFPIIGPLNLDKMEVNELMMHLAKVTEAEIISCAPSQGAKPASWRLWVENITRSDDLAKMGRELEAGYLSGRKARRDTRGGLSLLHLWIAIRQQQLFPRQVLSSMPTTELSIRKRLKRKKPDDIDADKELGFKEKRPHNIESFTGVDYAALESTENCLLMPPEDQLPSISFPPPSPPQSSSSSKPTAHSGLGSSSLFWRHHPCTEFSPMPDLSHSDIGADGDFAKPSQHQSSVDEDEDEEDFNAHII